MGRALNTIFLQQGIKTLTTADGIKNTDTHIIEKEDQQETENNNNCQILGTAWIEGELNLQLSLQEIDGHVHVGVCTCVCCVCVWYACI